VWIENSVGNALRRNDVKVIDGYCQETVWASLPVPNGRTLGHYTNETTV